MKSFLILFLLQLFIFKMNAQDTIKLKNGQLIAVKIDKVEEHQLSYHFYNLPNGPLFTKNLVYVNWVKYNNGYIDTFNYENKIINKKPENNGINETEKFIENLTFNQLDSIAQKDVNENYIRTSGGAIFFTTLLTTPIIGGVTSLIVGSTPPNRLNLNLPNKRIIQNQQYLDLYAKKAYKVKKTQVRKNFLTGAVFNILIGMLFYSGTR